MSWSGDKSRELYSIDDWGKGYFRINEKGHIEVHPSENNETSLDLYSLTEDLRERGIRLPILIRFTDIVKARIELIADCFAKSIADYGYQGKYSGVYPIKVNQQRHLVEEVIEFGQKSHLGLECGSKPELLVALAMMDTPNAIIVCNGFKDRAYIETALLSQKLGLKTFVVIERMDELQIIIEASERLNIKPIVGFRCKLNSQGAGRWVESSGARSKFGLSPSEIVKGLKKLRDHDLMDCLQLLHFHIGSQIPSIQSIKSSIKEGARFFTELYAMGASPQFIDVGGGLGVDYDGSGSSDSSTNYSEQEYANDVVSIIQSICDEKKVPHPNIISESGRALVAHSSVLVFDILGFNQVAKTKVCHEKSGKDSRLVQDLWEIYENIRLENINEFYNDLIEKKRDTLQLFTYGVLSLEQRAIAEDIYWATASKMRDLASQSEDTQEIYWDLEKELSDTYFCNFSVFQSLPDAWAMGQLFPVMPIHRLNEKPERRATLVDLTCDSDGKIDRFIDEDSDEPQNYLEVHAYDPSQPYYLGVFLTGAYQEILGDLHNLFGDTDAVHVTLNQQGYSIDHVVQGDSVSQVLNYVEYHKHELLERIRQASESSILRHQLTRSESRLLMDYYEQGLSGYTYLED